MFDVSGCVYLWLLLCSWSYPTGDMSLTKWVSASVSWLKTMLSGNFGSFIMHYFLDGREISARYWLDLTDLYGTIHIQRFSRRYVFFLTNSNLRRHDRFREDKYQLGFKYSAAKLGLFGLLCAFIFEFTELAVQGRCHPPRGWSNWTCFGIRMTIVDISLWLLFLECSSLLFLLHLLGSTRFF